MCAQATEERRGIALTQPIQRHTATPPPATMTPPVFVTWGTVVACENGGVGGGLPRG